MRPQHTIVVHGVDEWRDSVRDELERAGRCQWISVDGSRRTDEPLHITAHHWPDARQHFCECGQVRRP